MSILSRIVPLNVLLLAALAAPPAPAATLLELTPGDRIVIIGNTLAERMQYYGHFETLLQSRFAGHELVVQNLGWSAEQLAFGWSQGDEERLFRSAGFADHGHRLSDHKPDVVIACFGFNESFAGSAGLDDFRTQLRKMIEYLTTSRFNGEHPPKLVLVTPIPHENLRRPGLPDGNENNKNLRLYSDAIVEEAARAGVMAVDVFRAMQPVLERDSDFTINGIHLNEEGNAALAEVLDRQLFGPPTTNQNSDLKALRQAVLEKNRQFFMDYRAVNGCYIYGGRKTPFGVVNFPEEFAKLRRMIAARDKNIWAVAQGQAPAPIDDAALGDLVRVESNVDQPSPCLSPEEQLKTFEVPEGYEVTLFASEREFPELANPCHMVFDGAGRLWVCTMPTYPMYLPGEPPNDRILVLEDTDGDGRADRRRVFADGLHLPTGIELGDGGAYVAQQPNLVFMKDDDGDGKADRRELILHGFDSGDSHHAISAFTWGPGGELYFQEGTFHHSQIETPYGPQRVKDAGVFRFDPKTYRLDVYVSYGFANPWGHCFDHWGQNFISDASNGNDYFAAAFSGNVIFPRKHREMRTLHPRTWRPTAGSAIVSSANFPSASQGNFVVTNCIGFQGVMQYRLEETGSGFRAEWIEPLLSSTDTACRPVDVKFAPDGTLYVCDWYNPLIGHMQHNLRDPNRDRAHGRIWRIRYTERPLADPPQIEDASVEELVRVLESSDAQHRYSARRELRSRPTAEVLAALGAWLEGPAGSSPEAEHHRLEALWVQQHLGAVGQDLLQQVLTSPEPRARAAGVRALCYLVGEVDDAVDKLVRAAADEYPRVRLEAVRAASFLPASAANEVVRTAMQHPLDYYLQYVIQETTATLEDRGGTPGVAGQLAAARLASTDLAQDQVRPLVQIAAPSADAAAMAKIFASVVAEPRYSDRIRREVVRELQRESATRQLRPTVAADALLEVVQAALDRGKVQLAADILELAAAWRVSGDVNDFMRVALAGDTPAETARGALAVLASNREQQAGTSLHQLIESSSEPATLLRAATALADYDLALSCAALCKALSLGSTAYEAIQPAVQALLRHESAADVLYKELQNEHLDRDPARVLLRAIHATGTGHDDITSLVMSAAGVQNAKPLSSAQKEELARQIDAEGDPRAGELVYRRADLTCQKCHAISGAGGQIGPELGGIGATSPTPYLLDSILEPSLQIKEAFATRTIFTDEGKVYTGIVVESTPERVILRDAEGEEFTIATDQIDEQSDGPSLMPEGQQHLMTSRELIDLVKFLSVLGKPGDYTINRRPVVLRYQLLEASREGRRLAGASDERIAAMLARIPQQRWQSKYALVSGQLPLAEVLADAQFPLVLRAGVNVTTPGPLTVRVDPAVDARVFVGRQPISGDGSEAVEVETGEHAVFIILDSPPSYEYLTVMIERPSGAATQYTIAAGE